MKSINTIAQAKKYFKAQDNSFYFVSASNFNLMPIHNWVNNWFNVNMIDSYDGNNTSVLLPEYSSMPIFENIEQINQFLLGNKEIVEHIKEQKKTGEANVVFLFYNEDLEDMSRSLDINKIMPDNKLVKSIDNKITTTQIGNSVDVPSVPNALVNISSYKELCKVQEEHDLGSDVVIQTAFGDSGKTTFFISDEYEYQEYADKIEAEDKVKIMRKIDCVQIAIEGVATKNGTFVGPILTEIIGHPDLTPYQGGWCGNDIGASIFDDKTQNSIYKNTELLGQALYSEGYRGYFEVDYLLDKASIDDMPVYLGEINPRVTGISALTNMSKFCQEHIPLFLLHLLEFSSLELKIDPVEFNQKSKDFNHPKFGQLIFKCLEEDLKIVTESPQTGVYRETESGQMEYVRYEDDATNLGDDEFYILQILKCDEYAYKGADLLIIFTNNALKSANGDITATAKRYIDLINSNLGYRGLSDEEQQSIDRYGLSAPLKVYEYSG
jgi:biotin carboxylase